MIFLHIGRNKAGSTTLQALFSQRRAEIAAAGMDYLNFGHLAHSDPRTPGYATAPELAAHVRASGRDTLVSNEFMFAWPQAYTDAVAQALQGLPVTILAWLRPYADWLPSLYAQDVKGGDTALDFDAYAQTMADTVSAWPMLRGWAEAFGWANLRVRTLDPRDLEGGALVPDALSALALPASLATGFEDARVNASPGWIALELTRALRARYDAEGWTLEGRARAQAEALRLPDPGSPPDAARYLTPEQAARLDALYREDLRRVGEASGRAFPDPPRAVGRREGPPPAYPPPL